MAVKDPKTWLFLLCAALVSCGGEGESGPVELTGRAMGTTWRVTLASRPAGDTSDALRRDVAACIEAVEAAMSHWRDDSAVSRFNRSRSTEPMQTPSDLARVVAESIEVYGQTQGAFDVTVAPLVNLWGFGPYGPRGVVPTDAAIADALAHVGSDRLVLDESDPAAPRLSKTDPAVQIDLSAIAKGYTIDRVAAMLDARGIADYLIELGGELRGHGRSVKGRPWRVGLEAPDAGAIGRVRGAIELEDRAIATSGNYRLYFEAPAADGPKRATFSHIIDPRTGRPVGHGLVAVSVVADTAMRADALATALFVMGPARGYAFATEHRVAATLVERKGGGLVELTTPRFPRVEPADR